MRLKALIKEGNMDAAAQLLAAEGMWDVFTLNAALHEAAERRDQTMIFLLLERGADINDVNLHGETPLNQVLGLGYRESEHLPLVRALLEAGADPSWQRRRPGFTPLQRALSAKAWQTARLLVAYGADMNQPNRHSQTALSRATFKAAYEDDWTALNLLVELGADLNAGFELFRPLTVAAGWGRVDLMARLVEAGAEVNTARPLIAASGRGSVEAVRWLLEAGADPNHPGGDQAPFIYAIDHNRPEIVRLFLDYGARVDVKFRSYKGRKTPLEYARADRYINAEILQMLVEALAVHNAELAQMEAARAYDMGLVTAGHTQEGEPLAYWLEKGAHPNARNAYGRTALHYVAERGESLSAVCLLLEAGADVNARDPFGYTPLHDSVLGDNAEIIQLLLDAGADPAARVERGIHAGYTALEIARIERKEHAIRLLKPLSPEPRPLTPCEPELRRNGSVKGFSHIYYEEDAAESARAKKGERGTNIYLCKTAMEPYWTGREGEPQHDTEPCVHTIDYDIRSQYRGTGIARAEHPLRWRMAMEGCLHCGSEDVLVIHADWGVQPHSGDAAWSYEVKCRQCGYYSSWGYHDG